MALPGRDLPWPREHYLAFKHPVTRVASGQDFEVELIDRNGPPPDDARIVYRYLVDGQPADEEYEKPIKLGDVIMVRRKTSFAHSNTVRSAATTHGMEWISVEVVEPPAVESVAITLHPPDYSGWPAADPSGESRLYAELGWL